MTLGHGEHDVSTCGSIGLWEQCGRDQNGHKPAVMVAIIQ